MSQKDLQQAHAREDEENARLFGGGQSRPKKKKGLSDDDIIASGEGLEDSSRVPRWFFAIIAVVVVAAFALSLPFWGDRPDSPRPWYTWGHAAALAYMLVFGGFVYAMTMMYDPDKDDEEDEHHEEK
ncbi:MAG: hypothetical protein COA61_007545 [Zetaproteobacteria bacterium]|nr:hypothetical protein [Zetaproteobacteria bacterium]